MSVGTYTVFENEILVHSSTFSRTFYVFQVLYLHAWRINTWDLSSFMAWKLTSFDSPCWLACYDQKRPPSAPSLPPKAAPITISVVPSTHPAPSAHPPLMTQCRHQKGKISGYKLFSTIYWHDIYRERKLLPKPKNFPKYFTVQHYCCLPSWSWSHLRMGQIRVFLFSRLHILT